MSSERWRLPPILLPDGEPTELWVVDGRLTRTPPGVAEPLPGRFALPGLVDAHAHVAVGRDRARLDVDAASAALGRLSGEGILAVRDLGAPGGVTLRITPELEHPRFQAAGRWLAPAGRFYEQLHEPVAPDELLASARAEVATGARWVKLIADWTDEALSYDGLLLRQVVELAHAAGARVAAHVQGPAVGEVVAAGVDSVEHGCGLDPITLDAMVARGVAWTPTLTALSTPFPPDVPAERRERQQGWLENVRGLLAPAAARGVTILAGTDIVGSVVDEVRHLIRFGLEPVDALRAASTTARAFLGLPGLEEGAPADVVTFAADPRLHPDALAEPAAIILRGRRLR